MVNKKVTRQHILDALSSIDREGVPANRKSTKFNLYHNGKSYPPKYVLSIATRMAIGKELEPSQFNGGDETNNFLSTLDFTIREGNLTLPEIRRKPTGNNNHINICTALFQTPYSSEIWNKTNNKLKIELLAKLMQGLNKNTDILVLPAGFMNCKNKKPETIFKDTEKAISELVIKYNPSLFVCLGVDGRNDIDQLALAISKTGIVAIARKFHHKGNRIDLAKDAFAKENNMPRHFLVKGKRPYLAVCYDIYGISQKKLENKNNYDFIIGLIHGFDNKHRGESYFARKGLAGASKQWNVHSFASTVFNDCRNPTNWTSGVKWTHGNSSVKDFTYDQIRINSKLQTLETDLGTIYLRYYEE